ncbi:MAG: outer membrane protein assembly factor BamE [Gammaproteobacteria bacterium]|nr:outer membrane protein assembly factor BamE [Gammaproteobacteria bacterium]
MYKYPAILLLALTLSACVSTYRADVQQGNVVTAEMVGALKPGMTKRQVRYALGTPLVADPFHKDRWDYVYSFQKGSGKRNQQQLTLIFQDDALVTIEGDLAQAARTNP